MNTSELVSIVLQLGRPVHLEGQPGIGKTAFFQDLVEKIEHHLVTFIASTREPSDITGFPAVVPGDEPKAEFLPVPTIRQIVEMDKDGIPSVVFLDEISTAPPAMQAACLRFLHERIAGNTKLPQSTLFALASNPVGTSAGTFTLSAAMANRMFHFPWEPNAEAWCIGMVQGFEKAKVIVLPKNWKSHLRDARTLVSSYIGVNRNELLNQPKDTKNQSGPWASPRTWDMASEAIAALMSLNLPPDDLNEAVLQMLSACVGPGSAAAFLTWFENRDLRSPKEYLLEASTIELPERSDQLYTILNSVVSYLIGLNEMKKKDWDAGWQLLGRAAQMGKADFAAIPAKILIQNRPKGFQIPHTIAAFMPALEAAGLLKSGD